jgi:hypothetical protein
VGKLTVGHQKRQESISHLFGRDCEKTLHTVPPKLSREEIWVAIDFFSNREASKGPQVLTDDVKIHLNGGLAFAKKIPAVLNIWVTDMNRQKILEEKRRICAYDTA